MRQRRASELMLRSRSHQAVAIARAGVVLELRSRVLDWLRRERVVAKRARAHNAVRTIDALTRDLPRLVRDALAAGDGTP